MGDLRIGGLFSGYGGLELATEMVFVSHTAWVCDNAPAAAAVLEERFAFAPNLGDITVVDWRGVPGVDVIVGGSPCQDMSTAGRREGMRAGNRSGLWSYMRDAIEVLRPKLVIWENVDGARNADADSNVEPCPICMGGAPQLGLRAPGRVLGDLADLGFDALWTTVRASDVGAPHERARLFVLAWVADAALDSRWLRNRDGGAAADAVVNGVQRRRAARHRRSQLAHGHREPALTLFPTPTTQPATGNGHARCLAGEVIDRFEIYAPAVARWAQVLDRPPPQPTIPAPGRRTGRRLSPVFIEWMMGLLEGWVTDVAMSPSQQAGVLGAGVVPLQGAAAISDLFASALALQGEPVAP